MLGAIFVAVFCFCKIYTLINQYLVFECGSTSRDPKPNLSDNVLIFQAVYDFSAVQGSYRPA